MSGWPKPRSPWSSTSTMFKSSPQTRSMRVCHRSFYRHMRTSPQCRCLPQEPKSFMSSAFISSVLVCSLIFIKSFVLCKTGKFFMMCTKSSLLRECFSSLYFLALKSLGWGSVPHSIWKKSLLILRWRERAPWTCFVGKGRPRRCETWAHSVLHCQCHSS